MKHFLKSIFIISCFMFLFSCEKNKEIGIISDFNGDIIINNENNIKIGHIVYINDVIETKINSELTIILEDKSLIRLGEGSIITIKEKILSNKKYLNIKINYGYIWGRILQTQQSKYNYNFQNNDIIAAIRGTSFFLNQNEIISIDSGTNKGIKIKDKTNNKNILINNEVKYSHELGKKDIDVLGIYKSNDFIKKSTKKDLIFMENLKNTDIHLELLTLINNELDSTRPTLVEIKELIDNKNIDELFTSNYSLYEIIKKDNQITKIRLSNIPDEEKNISIYSILELNY